MLNIALTGNVAAGKSTVVRWFAKWGATIIDSDALVREVQQPGSRTLAALADRFGQDVLRPDGSLNRSALRSRVLANSDALSSLNAIVHPAVQRRRQALVAEAAQRGDRIVVNDIPLLFEVLNPDEFDIVVLVDAPVELRRERLIRRGLNPEDASRLIASQLPSDRKRARSDIVIDNGGTLDRLRHAACQAWEVICERATGPNGGQQPHVTAPSPT
jgi:dephospho-CoA kinase